MQRSRIVGYVVCLLLAGVLLAGALMVGGCGNSSSGNSNESESSQSQVENTASSTPAVQSTPPQLPAGALFQVWLPDGSAKAFTLDDMKKMPSTDVTIEGKVESGPKLSDILGAAGVTTFTKVTLTGATGGPNVLTADQVNGQTVLDLTNHQTVKIGTTAIPKPDWVKDIYLIKVE